MGETGKKKDKRIQAAKGLRESAEETFRRSEVHVDQVYRAILFENGLDPKHLEIPETWDCEKSPVETCVYNPYEDPCHDQCIFCGDPEERK